MTIEPALTDDQQELADLIGMDNYQKLVDYYGGTSIYIQKKDSITRTIRDKKIYAEFNGSNYRYLARKHKLSEQQTREIIKQQMNNYNEQNQIKFDI